jgi:sugar lactone lactonase YvrE
VTRGDVTVLADGLSFLEGPRWHDGRLYVSDFYTHRVLSLDGDGALEPVCTVPGQPSGLGFDARGRLLVVSMVDRRLLRLEGDVLHEVADLGGLAPFHCKDMVVDADGAAYVGNFGWDEVARPGITPTALIRVDPDGTPTVAARELVFPNGMAITPDGGTLLVAETFAGRITAFDIGEDGALANRRVWADLAPRRGLSGQAPGAAWTTIADAVASGRPLPDGLALDEDGAVWIGDAAGSGPLRVVEGGEIVERVDTGPLSVYAVALGGADRRTLSMCASPPLLETDPSTDHRAQLLACRVAAAGVGRP